MNPQQPIHPVDQPVQNGTPPAMPDGSLPGLPQAGAQPSSAVPSMPAAPSGPSASSGWLRNKSTKLAAVSALTLVGISLIILGVILSQSGGSPKNGTANPGAAAQPQDTRLTDGGDSERQDDLRQLQSYLEAYGYDHHKYPTFTNVNDPAFRKTVFAGLDTKAFQDPAGSSSDLASTPQPKIYSYQTTPATCDNTRTSCTSYTLTTILSTGQKWKLESFGL